MAREIYKPFKTDVISVLENAYTSEKVIDQLREFVVTTEFKQLFGQRMVDEIVTRTRDQGIDMRGKSMGKYSKAYKNSLIFDIYGKGDMVDLTLTGEMLDSLSYEASRKIILIDVNSANAGKAEGHITGILGKFGRAKPRPFLGLPDSVRLNLFREAMKDYRSGDILNVAAEVAL